MKQSATTRLVWLTADIFEELLATYPAEKRELARQVYSRFAEGDSTQFFTQLFIVLDIYAQYAERVPQAVIEANQRAHAQVAKLRDEISLVAQAMDKRNLNITRIAAAWCASNSVKSVETPSFTSETKRGNTLNGFSIPRMCGTYSG